MTTFIIKSYAKINLALNITEKSSKLHKIESIVSFIDLHDLIYLNLINSKNHLLMGNYQKILIKKIQFLRS